VFTARYPLRPYVKQARFVCDVTVYHGPVPGRGRSLTVPVRPDQICGLFSRGEGGTIDDFHD
jgi:hypothetical protein